MSDTIKNAEEMLKHLAEFSKDCFDKNGEVMPMWIIVSDKEIIPVITQFSGTPGEKQELFKFIQAKAKEVDAHVSALWLRPGVSSEPLKMRPEMSFPVNVTIVSKLFR